MSRANWVLTGVFAIAIALSSYLLFVVQPFVAKLLLPYLGGSAMVWNVSMVFFQIMLLLGYLYAHFISRHLKLSHQVMLHLMVVGIACLTLPPNIPSWLGETELLTRFPAIWLLNSLFVTCGLAYFCVATTTPLLQTWFVRATGHQFNPYTLFAASNLGSLIALASYPLFVEPALRLQQQSWAWAIGFGVFCTLLVATALTAYRRSKVAGTKEEELSQEFNDDYSTIGIDPPLRHLAYWLSLAFVPSALMLGVTVFITTDVAAIPLLWTIPLGLYLLSFVVTFLHYSETLDTVLARSVPLLVLGSLFFLFTEVNQHMLLVSGLHLITFFTIATVCHGRLALSKPASRHLTVFYLLLSFGGALGGIFVSLIAPIAFDSLIEYPLLLGLAAIIAVPYRPKLPERLREWAVLMVAAVTTIVAINLSFWGYYWEGWYTEYPPWLEQYLELDVIETALWVAVPTMVAMAFSVRPYVAAVATFSYMMAFTVVDWDGNTIWQKRSYYGVISVTEYDDPPVYALVHGNILHGEQRIDSAEQRLVPRTYYSSKGPLGDIMASLHDKVERPAIAAIGLGAGTIATYGTQNNEITFYELDPLMVDLASNPKYFSYLSDCRDRGCNLDIVIGDGRLKLRESFKTYDLIVVDAFSSDSIPIHLITQEAVAEYFQRLTTSGILAFHISNRYVNLEPVLANLAHHMELGYAVLEDQSDNEEIGKSASTWVIMATNDGLFSSVASRSEDWRGTDPDPGVGIWADDYAKVISTMTFY